MTPTTNAPTPGEVRETMRFLLDALAKFDATADPAYLDEVEGYARDLLGRVE